MMKVYVVYADDHDYDVMSQWLVGVYSSLDAAEVAAYNAKKKYNSGCRKYKGFPNIEIYETEIDQDFKSR